MQPGRGLVENIGGSALLLQRDGGWKPLDLVDIRDGHLVEETPRVWGHLLQIPPLSLGVKRAECEG